MDAALLTSEIFWSDPTPVSAGIFPGEIPDYSDLRGHVLFETSGSSGTPKWIAISKPALLASAEAVNRHLEVDDSSRWGLALPLRHVGGFGVVARAYLAGCAFHEFTSRWDTVAFAAWLGENHITHTSLVPTQVHDIVLAGIARPSSLRAVVVGGGRLENTTGEAARALGWPVLASYGMTEAASQIATQCLSSLSRPYQASPIPVLPHWNVDTDEQSRLRISGPALFSGILLKQSDTWVFRKRENAWHRTEDRVQLSDRCITPLGRADVQVKVLGELVDPSSIEMTLAALSDGTLAPGSFAVVAVPDARAGSVLVPVFDCTVPREIADRVLTLYYPTSPGFKRLRPPVFMHLPRGPLGKIQRSEIAVNP